MSETQRQAKSFQNCPIPFSMQIVSSLPVFYHTYKTVVSRFGGQSLTRISNEKNCSSTPYLMVHFDLKEKKNLCSMPDLWVAVTVITSFSEYVWANKMSVGKILDFRSCETQQIWFTSALMPRLKK